MAQTRELIELPDFLTVRELANVMARSPIEVIKELMSNGIMANINQQIDFDTAAIVATEMGFEVLQKQVEPEIVPVEEAEASVWRQILAEQDESLLQPRPPVITMLGHVDHGKTSLLDIIRHSNVQAGEAGGITQHIGAYQAVKEGQLITFLDTPGHEAFTAMRARGAQATDIAILVVAADDGVMPQTREAIDHARAAHVPIIVALNKIDLPNANPLRVMQQLNDIGLTPDEWDGDTMVIPVSARDKRGIDDLLQAILLVAEELAPRANPQSLATGVVLEARKERGRGIVATLLVQNGTLRLGDTLLVGEHYGRIKAMYNYLGKSLKEASPSTPVSVSGLNGIPTAGDSFRIVDNEKTARKIVSEILEPVGGGSTPRTTTLDEFFARLQQGELKTLNLIVKADVQGSIEPLVTALNKLDSDEVSLEVLRAATGNITESDVMLASASGAVILGFNVGIDTMALAAAANEHVEIKTYTVIYHLLEDVEKALKGMLEPTYEQVVIGRAEVRQVFKIRNAGRVAGCFMRTGEGRRNSQARLIRQKKLIYSGNVSSLKHLQDSVRDVKAGFEFGMRIDEFDDYEPGDIIEFFVTQRVEAV